MSLSNLKGILSMKGNFVVHKSERTFSKIGINKDHEKNNALIKGDGGAVGLTEQESALLRLMVAGPEICRLAAQYETLSWNKETIQTKHCDETSSAQKAFLQGVHCLTKTIEEMVFWHFWKNQALI